jgi:hypothetical protein
VPGAAIVAAVASALAAIVVRLRRVLRQAIPVGLQIVRPAADTTEIDPRTGAVRSVQSVEVVLGTEQLDALWNTADLERLARTYWSFLSRATLGVVRVYYTEHGRDVCLRWRPLKLLTFRAPEYELDERRGRVRWRIDRGVLVARAGRGGDGHLQIDVERRPAAQEGHVNVAISVEVANFYPAISSRLGRFVYTNTQSRVHVIVTLGFLRSLAQLDLEPSVVGRFGAPVRINPPAEAEAASVAGDGRSSDQP